MTGPEHYREAERLIGLIRELPQPITAADAEITIRGTASLAAQAQAHATLALAAATAVPAANAYDGDEDHSRSRGWAGVA